MEEERPLRKKIDWYETFLFGMGFLGLVLFIAIHIKYVNQ